MKWLPIAIRKEGDSYILYKSEENTFPFEETDITFEDGFEPELAFDYIFKYHILFIDRKTKTSIANKYYNSFRYYTFVKNENKFINETDFLIDMIERRRANVGNESLVNEVESFYKLIFFGLDFSLNSEENVVTKCSRHYAFLGFVSHLYRYYF